jgi:hypothetical protein
LTHNPARGVPRKRAWRAVVGQFESAWGAGVRQGLVLGVAVRILVFAVVRVGAMVAGCFLVWPARGLWRKIGAWRKKGRRI